MYRSLMVVVLVVVLALAAAAGARVGGRSDAAGGASGAARAVWSRSCARACAAGYRAIAEALPNDRDSDLVRVILRTPNFDYLELARALHVPTIAQIGAQWRRYCHGRFLFDSRALAICLQMIDSWKPGSLPGVSGWARS